MATTDSYYDEGLQGLSNAGRCLMKLGSKDAKEDIETEFDFDWKLL